MTNPDFTYLSLVLDRSGSMSNIAGDMNGGIAHLLKEQAALPGKLLVDVTTFDSVIERPFVGAKAEDIPINLIIPRNMTALLDATGTAIAELGEKLAALPEDERPGTVIVVVVTDGIENASKEYSAEQIKELVTKQETEFGWKFVFLGANIDSFGVGGNLGYARGSTMNYDASAAGVRGATVSVSSYLSRTRSGLDTEFTEEERTISSLNL